MVISQIESVEVAAVEDGEGSGPLDGKVERVPLSHLESDQMRKSWRLDVGVMAMDRNHAIRIAADKFREFIANGGDQ